MINFFEKIGKKNSSQKTKSHSFEFNIKFNLKTTFIKIRAVLFYVAFVV